MKATLYELCPGCGKRYITGDDDLCTVCRPSKRNKAASGVIAPKNVNWKDVEVQRRITKKRKAAKDRIRKVCNDGKNL